MSTSTKVKTPKGGPIERLYLAADEIIRKSREAFREAGQTSPEIRLPILIHGTDMRITIEAGPKIAARNAIEHAQMKASGKPVEPIVDMSQALAEAQALLKIMAEERTSDDEKRRCAEAMSQLAKLERLL